MNHPNTVKKIITGGQTGADRAVLDFALKHQFDFGGWVPKGRKAEDGALESTYSGLTETDSSKYSERTRLNVRDSDATLILYRHRLLGGSKYTAEVANELGKPVLAIDLEESDVEVAVSLVRDFLSDSECRILNIAGPRSSEDNQIYARVYNFLTTLFC